MDGRWRLLEAHADHPEIQEEIRQGIREREFRVVPARNEGIRIIPADSIGTVTESPTQEETHEQPRSLVPRARRLRTPGRFLSSKQSS